MEAQGEQRKQELRKNPIRIALSFLVALLLTSLAAGRPDVGVADWKTSSPIELELGDVIVRKGHGFWTRFFIDASTREKRFSHVGIVVETDANPKIAHAEGDDLTGIGSVKVDTWRSFFAAADECAIFRYENGTNVSARIVTNAKAMIGVPFDPLFDMSNTNRLYCSEFVRLAVNSAAGEEVVGFTKLCGRSVVAIDDIYRKHFIRVYDSKPQKGRESK